MTLARLLVEGYSEDPVIGPDGPMPKRNVSIALDRRMRLEQSYTIGFSLFGRHMMSVDMRTNPRFSIKIRGESNDKGKRKQ